MFAVDCVNLLIPGDVDLVAHDNQLDSNDMPRVEELLASVRNFLRKDVMDETTGRTNFLARVASNSLDIVIREQSVVSRFRHEEHKRLKAIFDSEEKINELRWALTRGLREGSAELDDPKLLEYLRFTVVNQVAIDQPNYSGYKTAIS